MNQVRAGNPSQYFVNAIGVLRRAAAALAPLAEARTGVAAVEFAMVAPLLLGMLVPVVDLGMAYSQRIQVQLAAEAGAQYAASHPWNTNSATTIANAVRAATPLSGVAATPAPNQTCGCPNGSIIAMASCGSKCANGQTAGYYVVVNAQLPYTPKLPYSVLGRSTMLTAQATVRIR